MGLNDFVEYMSCNVTIPSILDNPDNKLSSKLYVDLYSYFVDNNGQSYHTLVDCNTSGIKEEYSLLMNDVDIVLMTINGYGWNYEIQGNLLTIQLYIKDYHEQPAIIPFIYDVTNSMTLYEINILLKQEYVDMFFIELINDTLMIEHKMEIVIPDEFKKNVRNDLDKYISDKVSEIIGDSNEKEHVVSEEQLHIDIDNDEDYFAETFERYNWVDAKDIAKNIFSNYSFEIAWAEDAWNILMFEGIVKPGSIAARKHTDFEYGDIILWLVALYDIYFNYKVAADYESIDEEDLMEYIYNVDSAESYIGAYLHDDIYQELNEQLLEGRAPECEFYDIDSGEFVFSKDSIAFEVFKRDVESRKEIITEKIYSCLEDNTILISEFMEGTHWADNYFDMKAKQKKIHDKFDKILAIVEAGYIVKRKIGESEFAYENTDEVNNEREEELKELDDECDRFKSDGQQAAVYGWISNYMIL